MLMMQTGAKYPKSMILSSSLGTMLDTASSFAKRASTTNVHRKRPNAPTRVLLPHVWISSSTTNQESPIDLPDDHTLAV